MDRNPGWNRLLGRAWIMVGAILGLGLVLTISLFAWARREAARDIAERFTVEGLSQSARVRAYIQARLIFLDDLARHMELAEVHGPEDFRAFVAAERSRAHGIQALEWAPLVRLADRPRVEAKLAAPGGTIRFSERGVDGALRMAGPRPVYFPVLYLEPIEGNRAALGYDLGSDPARLAAIEAARDSGQARATEPLTLVQEKRAQVGFLILVPVYRKGLPTLDVAQRRAAFQGVVLGAFRTGDLLAAALDRAGESRLLRGELLDPAATGFQGALAAWGPSDRAEVSGSLRLLAGPMPSLVPDIPVADRTWVLRIEPTAAYLEAYLQRSPWSVLAGGLALTGLLAALLHLAYTQKGRAERLVRERSRALRESMSALQQREEDLRLLLNSTGEAIYGIDVEGCCTFCNQAALAVLGFHRPEDLVGRNMHQLIHHAHPDGRPMAEEDCQIYRAFREGRGTHVEGEVLWRADGTSFPAEYWSFPQQRGGQVVGAVVTFVDISERLRADAEIRRMNEEMALSLRRLQARNREVARLTDLTAMLQACQRPEEAHGVLGRLLPELFQGTPGFFALANPALEALELVCAWGDGPGGRARSLHRDDCWAVRMGRLHLSEAGGAGLACMHLEEADGHAHLCMPMAGKGDASGLLCLQVEPGGSEAAAQLARAVTEAVALSLANLQLHETLRQQSISDPLTGLYNRRFMQESLAREVVRARRNGGRLGVLMADIDHFKRLNDEWGHATGDAVLSQVGALLKTSVRGSDIACRFGGEEFVLILPDATPEGAVQRAEALRAACQGLRLDPLGGKAPGVTLSIGVALFPAHADGGEDLLRQADAALYRAKAGGRNCVRVAGPEWEPAVGLDR